MKQQTVNVLKAIVRFFISSFNSGNAITATTATIHTDVCRQLHITRQSNKNNYRGTVIEALRLLKKRIVLFETVMPKENDLLNKAVSIDNRTVYGLTTAAEEYVTRPHTDTPSVTSDRYITELLQHFGVLSAPAGVVEAQKEPEETTNMANNNVARIVAAIRNKSREWTAKLTPADLLGAMYALHNEDMNNPPHENSGMLSMARLNWPATKSHNYSGCYKVLEREKLIEPFKLRHHQTKRGDAVVRPYGFKLTPLGIEVASAGEFTDSRPAFSEQKTRSRGQKKTGGMLKRSPAPAEETVSPVFSELRDFIQLAVSRMDRMDEQLAQIRRSGGTPTVAEVTSELETETPPVNVEYDDMDTVSLLLMRAVPELVANVGDLLNEEHGRKAGTLPPGTTITNINTRGLYLGLTELEKTIAGIKCYISECVATGGDVNVELLQQYADAYRAAAEDVKLKRKLPVLGTTTVTKCVSRKAEAVTHAPWRRPEKARA